MILNYQLFLSAFTLGLLGSFHCIGMCGPLALSLPVSTKNNLQKLFAVLIYNFGRVLTYSAFGALFGIIGQSFSFFGWQQKLSIILGVLIIIFVLFSKKINLISNTQFFINSFFRKIRHQLSLLFQSQNSSSLFFIGVLNVCYHVVWCILPLQVQL
jgi:sulfite exporter TauE/SafE